MTRKSGSPKGQSPSRMIDARIKELGDWRGKTLARLRRVIKQADPEVVEEWKWRGVPVWSHDGLICTGETYRNVVKMTFSKGAALEDPSGLFNASLDGNTRRAIDFREGEKIDEAALKALIRAAVRLNASSSSSRRTGRRILGFGKHPEIAAAVQEKLRSLGFRATIFVLTNDDAGDARLVAELKRAAYDGVAIGGYINGQDAVNFPGTEETTLWFNRVLNIVHANAPGAKIILVRGPEDVVPAIERVLGKSLPA